MSYFMDKLLSEDMQNCTDPIFQSKRGEVGLSFLAAERYYTHHKRELDMLRRYDGPDGILARNSRQPGGGAPSRQRILKDVGGETRFVLPNPNWDEMAPLEQVRAVLSGNLSKTNMVPTYISRMGHDASLKQLEVCEQPQPVGPLGPEFERYDPPVDWRAMSDPKRAHIVLWGRWGEVGRNVPAYLRHLRVQAGSMQKDYFDELYQKQRRQEQSPQQTDPENQKEGELLDKLKKYQKFKEDYGERQRLRAIQARRSAVRSERRRLLKRAAWTKSGRGLLARNLNSRFHRRRHRLWRTSIPRTTWLGRLRHYVRFLRDKDREDFLAANQWAYGSDLDLSSPE